MMHLQERERRDLAKELHDEFGQCLSAINALLSSIKQTTVPICLDVITDTERMERITKQMLTEIRGMLCRLRPSEFDDLGLAASLAALIAGWNNSTAGKTVYRLKVAGDCGRLSESQAMALFRIVQEGLTNIHKHARATGVDVDLEVGADQVRLTVADNGVVKRLPLAATNGIGLLGIRERLDALHGQLSLALAVPQGLILTATFPIDHTVEAES
ncbi:MAG: sensor histidine kinase [Gammaproteobacteria bacterium]